MDGVTHKTIQNQYDKPVLSYAENSRMAGRIAVWENISGQNTAKDTIEDVLERALALPTDNVKTSDFAQALVDVNQHGDASDLSAADDAFGFADMIDLLNPLQHIPVVKTIYRDMTGDEIKPIAQMVGGAIFTGPLGVVMPLVNIVSQEETGKSIGENILALFDDADDQPAPDMASDDDSAPVLAAFADLSYQNDVVIVPDQPPSAADRPRYAHETRHYNE